MKAFFSFLIIVIFLAWFYFMVKLRLQVFDLQLDVAILKMRITTLEIQNNREIYHAP